MLHAGPILELTKKERAGNYIGERGDIAENILIQVHPSVPVVVSFCFWFEFFKTISFFFKQAYFFETY